MAATAGELNDESRGPEMVGAIVSTYFIAIAAVALRIVARRLGKVPLWIDDCLILTGMVWSSDRQPDRGSALTKMLSLGILHCSDSFLSTQQVSVMSLSVPLTDTILGIHLGAGRHIQTLEPGVFKSIEILFFTAEFTFCWAIGFIKCSMLAFYWRIFSTAASMRRLIWAITALVGAWVITFVRIFRSICGLNEGWRSKSSMLHI